MMHNTTQTTVTKLELAIKERELADLADELQELAETQSKEIQALKEALVAYVEFARKTIEELYNAQ